MTIIQGRWQGGTGNIIKSGRKNEPKIVMRKEEVGGCLIGEGS